MSEGNRTDIPAGIEDIMHSAYLQYSLSVNVGRAIPDVRDGLKPGNRRILYAMRQLGLGKSHSYTKCAKVVGEVIGNYHPHGDQAVYDTLVRMAQDFNMRATLVDGQGNFGSIDGDAPAAYRYTECRMERLAEELLTDIDKDTVDMAETFDGNNTEPVVLPARFPNLLVNGGTGIGVGMATNIPPHNLGEVIDATVHLIENPAASIRELMQKLPGPDFPTGAIITGIQPIIELYETGHGIIRVRGKALIEEGEKHDRIIVTELPYAVNKENLVSRIAELVNDKRLAGISGLRDESSKRAGIRIVIDLKRDAMANVVLNQLYAHTALQSSYGCQFLVVDRNRPRTMNLRQILEAYIDHRLEVITRRTRFELAKAEARAHILEGLLIAVANIDEVVRIIRASRTRDEAGERLIERFELSKRQAAAILDMRLHQLVGLAMEELQSEYDELLERIAYYKELLASRELLMGVVKEELLEIRQRYADARRTEIRPGEKELNIEDLIERGTCVVAVSAAGYVKRVDIDQFRIQNRGGIGVRGMQTRGEDYVEHVMTACTHDYILFFTNRGLMHWLKVYDIPEGTREGRGKAIVNLIELAQGESVRAMLTVSEVDVEDKFLFMATRNGTVKKTPLNAFKNLRRKGIRSIVLDEDNDLIDVQVTDGNRHVILSSAAGMACRFHENDVRSMGRVAAGVRGMELRDADGNLASHLVAMTVVDDGADLFVITRDGHGKRSHIGTGLPAPDGSGSDGYRLTRRGSRGVIGIRLREGDEVVAVLQLREDREVIMTTVNGTIQRFPTDDIRPLGRSAKGVIVMRLREGDAVSSVSLVEEVAVSEDQEPSDDQEQAAEDRQPEAAVEKTQEAPADDAGEKAEETQAQGE